MRAPRATGTSRAELVAQAVGLAATGRALLGITGPPGAGKSTLAQAVVESAQSAGVPSVLVPMDGFHLANAELDRLGRRQRKGAPDTFDAAGFVALLARIRHQRPDEGPVYAPLFLRAREAALAGAIAVPPTARLVVVEGNYLLHDDGPWAGVLPLLDACWYLDLDDAVRVERLVARHVQQGRTPEDAREWVLRSDEANARLVASGRDRASLVVPAVQD